MLPVKATILSLCLLFPSLILVVLYYRRQWRSVSCPPAVLSSAGNVNQSNTLKLHSKGIVEVQFAVPERLVGYVIGRRGTHIHKIQDETGAKVRVKERLDNGDKMIVISGRPESVEKAESAVRSAVQKKLTEEKDHQQVQFDIADRDVGKLIGKRGANIRSIQRQSGTKITIEDGSVGEFRQCSVTGNSKQIEDALLLIADSVQVLQRPATLGNGGDFHDPPVHLIPCSLLTTGDYFVSFVSAVDGEGGVWIQPMEQRDAETLEALVQEMTHHYGGLSENDLRLENVAVGGVCAAPFEHDSSWYRAVITGVASQDTASVVYVDYGDCGSLPLTQLKILRSEFYPIPCQAVRCVLDGITPTNGCWSEESLQLIDELTHCASWRPVMVKAASHSRHSVTIIDTNTEKDVNVAEELVKKGVAEWIGDKEEPLPPLPLTTLVDQAQETLQSADGLAVGDSCLPLGHFPAFVIKVVSVDLLYILPSLSLRPLAHLMDNMKSVYNTLGQSSIPLASLKESQLVAVCPENHMTCAGDHVTWFRGQVLSTERLKGQVDVQLLDYGAILSLPLSRVLPLREEFCHPRFAIPCSLGNVTISDGAGSAQLKKKMALQLAEWTKPGNWENIVLVEALVSNDQCLAVLFFPHQRLSINQQLHKEFQLAYNT